jgi:hypothetical protein
MRSFLKNIGIFVIAMVVLAFVANLVRTSKVEVRTVGLSELAASVQRKEVKKIQVMESELKITKADGAQELSRKEPTESLPTVLRSFGVTPEQLATAELSVTDQSGWKYWMGVLIPIFGPIINIHNIRN